MNEMNKINGRTPEEIKKGLECCTDICDDGCDACVYDSQYNRRDKLCLVRLKIDALSYIRRLERERDAAVEDMKAATLCGCHVCKHYYRPNPEARKYACRIHGSFEEHDFIADDGSIFCGAFEWRGVQEVE